MAEHCLAREDMASENEAATHGTSGLCPLNLRVTTNSGCDKPLVGQIIDTRTAVIICQQCFQCINGF
jgi:hypothetical protein